MNKKILTVYDDNDPLNNVISALTLKADEIFFVYHHEVNKKNFENIDKVLKKYLEIKTTYIMLEDDKKQLSEIFQQNKDLIVDVGGAKYLSLVLFEMVKDTDNKIIYYDDDENCIKDYRSHTILYENVFKLQIEDVLCLRGGEIKEYMHRSVNDKQAKDAIVSLVENNMENYGAFIRYITKLNSIISSAHYLGANTYQLEENQRLDLISDAVYDRISELFTIKEGKLKFTSKKLKEMTAVAGAFLENYLYIKLSESGKFDDIKMSAVIDFAEEKYIYPVRCEIDCLIIKDNKLLFVSCKSTKADASTLNEIYVHNHRFGNVLSMPVLCVCEDLDRKYPSTYAKGEELGIYLVDRSSFMNGEISEVFASILDGTYVYDLIS
ncbi:MAG: DUF1887 family protein [Erysipelotrichaceae bacterium]|nr:DUF1887 family protein [Erysipelotrichaceae bacterium]